MFNLRIERDNVSLKMGHRQSEYKITTLSGIDGMAVEVTTSQGFDQIGESVDSMSVSARTIGIIGRIDNFTGPQLRAMNMMFLPMTTVRVYFEEKYWIDAVIKSAPVYTYSLRTAAFSIELLAAYPYWKSVSEHSYRLGGSYGGFNFPISYNVPHNFELYGDSLTSNCINNGNTKVDYTAELRCSSGTVTNVTLTNAGNQKFVTVKTEITSSDTVKIFRENNILRVTKTTGNATTDIFSDLDEDSDLFYMEVGDNVIKASSESGDGLLVVTIRFSDTVVGVRYGI